MAVTRRCVCCGKTYEYCPNCAKASQPVWMVSFCSEGCKGLFNVVSAYKAKRIDRNAVSDYVNAHALSNKIFVGEVQKTLDEVVNRAVDDSSIKEENVHSTDNREHRPRRTKRHWYR